MSSVTHVLALEEALALPVDPLDEIVDGEVRRMSQAEDAHAHCLRFCMPLLPSNWLKINTRFDLQRMVWV